MSFRDRFDAMDARVLDVLGDEVTIEGRPVPGFFSAPWVQPKVGQLRTGLREPVYSVRVVDAAGIAERQTLVCGFTPADGGGQYVITKVEPDGTGWVDLVLRKV